MLLTEQTRVLSSEQNQIDFGNASEIGLDYTWKTLENVGTITTGTACGVAWSFGVKVTLSQNHNLRIKLGSWYIYGTIDTVAGNYDGTVSGMCYVPNGTHTFLIEAKRGATTSGTLYNVQAGIFKLKDENISGTLSTIPLGVRGGTCTVDIPVRVTPCGSIINTGLHVNVWGTRVWNGTAAQCQFANIGDSLTGSVVLKIDGSQVNWNSRQQDAGGTETAHAYFVGTLPLGGTHTVEIYKGTATYVNWSVYASPWLLPGTENPNWPIDFRFPPGSTFYGMFEPLHRELCPIPNPTDLGGTVNSKIGRKRHVSMGGTATDYYSTLGTLLTSINTHNYTFEIVDPESVEWRVDGFGGCISHVAVDIR